MDKNSATSRSIVESYIDSLYSGQRGYWVRAESELPFPKNIIKKALSEEFRSLPKDQTAQRARLAMAYLELSHFVASDDAQIIRCYEDTIRRRDWKSGNGDMANRIGDRVVRDTQELIAELMAINQGIAFEKDAQGYTLRIPKIPGCENNNSSP